jgi:release factor H-coupled RctB family protein
VKQLEATAQRLPNIVHAIGMPDLHPGKGFPIGTAFTTEHIIYPVFLYN